MLSLVEHRANLALLKAIYTSCYDVYGGLLCDKKKCPCPKWLYPWRICCQPNHHENEDGMFLWLHKNGVSPHWEQVLREPWQLQRKCQTADLKQSSSDSRHSALYVLTFLPLYCTLFCWFFHPDEKYLNQWATPVKPLIYWNQFNEATESSSRRDLISSRKEEQAIVLPHWTFSARDGYAQQTQRQESGKNTMQRSRTTDNSMCHSLAGTHLHIKADTLSHHSAVHRGAHCHYHKHVDLTLLST